MNRDLIFKRELSYGIVCKVLSIVLNYLSIPLFLKYLGKIDYGIWMVIFSVLNWIYILDVGVGNGFVNKLTEAISLKKYKIGKEYIMTTYTIFFCISICLLLIGELLIEYINISKFLNIEYYSEKYIKNIFRVVYYITILNFNGMLYMKLYRAIQRNSVINIINIFIQSSILIGIIVINKLNIINLKTTAILYTSTNLIFGIIATYIFFLLNKNLRPTFKDFDKNKIKIVAKVGVQFFIIQICCLIIFNTGNILLLKYKGAEIVTNYVIVSKAFLLLKMVVALILNPMWPLFTDAYIKKDIKWLKQIFKKLYILYGILVLGVTILIFLLPFLLKLWIEKEIEVPLSLRVLWGICLLVSEFGGIHIIFLNAIGKIKLQMYLYILGVILYFFATISLIEKYGSEGLVLGIIISILPLNIVVIFQTKKIRKEVRG